MPFEQCEFGIAEAMDVPPFPAAEFRRARLEQFAGAANVVRLIFAIRQVHGMDVVEVGDLLSRRGLTGAGLVRNPHQSHRVFLGNIGRGSCELLAIASNLGLLPLRIRLALTVRFDDTVYRSHRAAEECQ